MKNFSSQLFLYCISGMSIGLVIFSLVCLAYFKEALMVNQILNYYGAAMLGGALIGILYYYLTELE